MSTHHFEISLLAVDRVQLRRPNNNLWRKRSMAEMAAALGCAAVAVGYVQTGRYLRALQKKISDFLLLKFWVRV
jgi:hypothetical protein